MTCINLLRRLSVKAERPIYLVLYGHLVHRPKKLRDFVEAHEGKLKLFFWRPYSYMARINMSFCPLDEPG